MRVRQSSHARRVSPGRPLFRGATAREPATSREAFLLFLRFSPGSNQRREPDFNQRPHTQRPCGLTSLPLRDHSGGCSETRMKKATSARAYIYRGKWNVAVLSLIIRLKHKPNIGHPTLPCLSSVPPTPVGLYITVGSVHSR